MRSQGVGSRNINVAFHNKEQRPDYVTDFGFYTTLNMGIEGNSKLEELPEMNPFLGGRREFIYLAGVLFGLALVMPMRKRNEQTLRSLTTATNRYAKMDLGRDNKPAEWTQ